MPGGLARHDSFQICVGSGHISTGMNPAGLGPGRLSTTRWPDITVKASTGKTSLLMARLSMPAEVKNHMDGEMQSFVKLCESVI
jgi:hypothetical protein